MTSITIPRSITYIGSAAFEKCNGLEKVIVKDLTAWCHIMFGDTPSAPANPLNCANHLYNEEGTEITDLIIPEEITSIGWCAFAGCSALKSITIPSNVTKIGEGAFSGCSGLTAVDIPENVTSIGWMAFAYCKGLVSVTIPNGVKTIDKQTFWGC